MLPVAGSSDFEHHESAVVGKRRALGEPVDFAEDEVGDFGGAQRVMALDELAQTLRAKELTFAVHGFSDTVGMKNHDVTGIEGDAPLVVTGLFENSKGKSCQLDLATAAILVEKRLGLAGIGHAKFAAALLPGCKAGGHEAAFDAALADELIHLAEHFSGLQFLRSESGHDADGDGSVKRRGGTFPADIGKSDANLLRSIAEKFVQVAANFAGRKVTRSHVEAVVFCGPWAA